MNSGTKREGKEKKLSRRILSVGNQLGVEKGQT